MLPGRRGLLSSMLPRGRGLLYSLPRPSLCYSSHPSSPPVSARLVARHQVNQFSAWTNTLTRRDTARSPDSQRTGTCDTRGQRSVSFSSWPYFSQRSVSFSSWPYFSQHSVFSQRSVTFSSLPLNGPEQMQREELWSKSCGCCGLHTKGLLTLHFLIRSPTHSVCNNRFRVKMPNGNHQMWALCARYMLRDKRLQQNLVHGPPARL